MTRRTFTIEEPEAVLPVAPSVEEIERFVEDAGSDDLPTFGGTHEGGIYVQQIPDEIAPCLHAMLTSGEPVRSYFELGVAAGGMTYLVDHFFRPQTIVLLDTDEHPRCKLRGGVLQGIKREEVIGKSEDDHVVTRVASFGIYFDAMMIDGVHYYENVRRDVNLYLPFLRPGGFLILHDTVRGEWGVPRVVAELKENPAFAFIGEWTSKTTTPCGVALFQRLS